MSAKHPDFFHYSLSRCSKERLKMYDVNIYFLPDTCLQSCQFQVKRINNNIIWILKTRFVAFEIKIWN